MAKFLNYIRVLFLAPAVMMCALHPAAAAPKPNIVLIVADDLGYGDLGVYGGKISTPNINALAKAGVRFTDFHTNAFCSPTRAAIMTGRYAEHSGIPYALPVNARIGLPPAETTIAEALKPAGYATGLVGKWHLGQLDKFSPLGQGFEYFFGFLTGEIDYVNHLDSSGHLDWWRMKTPLPDKEYSTNAITDEAIGFIKRNQSRPFFLEVSFQAVHAPYQAPGDPPIRVPNQPKHLPEGDPAHYPAMVQAMDQGIGKIVGTLSSLNIASKTLVFFLSDNGASVGSNAPLRAGKGTVYEGGLRVPAIASWPTVIKPAVRSDMLMMFDLFPTFLELAGLAVPASLSIDGKSLVPLLLRQQAMPAREFFWKCGTNYAVRDGKWKLTIIDGKTSLFDLSRDLGEKTNLAGSQAAIVGKMARDLNGWKAHVGIQ